MSGEKANGHDPMAQRMVEVLERIEGEIKGFRGEVNARIDALKTVTENALRRLDERLTETNHELADLGEELRGGPKGTLRECVEQLEAAVFKRTGT